MAEATLTDNDHVPSKVALRLQAIDMLGQPREIRVLDAFHGHGRLWKLVEDQLPEGWSIRMYRSDKEARRAGTLKIDNARLLESLDLSGFDLIDLDAYGWPTSQIRSVATRGPKVPVLSTRISRALGSVPKVVLADLGITFPKGTPQTLINGQLGDELWEAWLHLLGYRTSYLLRFDHGSLVKRYELLIPAGFQPA